MGTFQKSLQKIEDAAFRNRDLGTIYAVGYGDTLSQIIQDHYGIRENDPRYTIAETSVMYFNREIEHPDRIRAGNTLRLMPIPTPQELKSCPIPEDYHKQREISTRERIEPMPGHSSAFIRDRIPPFLGEEQDAYFTIANLYRDKGGILAATGGGMAAFGNIVKGSDHLLKDLANVHEQYYSKKMTRTEFVAQRATLAKEIKHRLGPFQSDLLGNRLDKMTRLSRRAGKRKGLEVSRLLDVEAVKIGRLANYARNGGILLTAAGAGLACVDIANTDDQQKKNEIFVETAISTFVGGAGSAALGIFMISNPVGWAVAIGLGFGVAAAAWKAGDASKKFYSTNLQEYDLVNMSGVDKLCK